MTRRIYICSRTGDKIKHIKQNQLTEILYDYQVVHTFHNSYGKVLVVKNYKNNRIHNIVVGSWI